eukprot:m51a1_g6899 putative protein serine threonine (2757) ;mRNA; r:30336-39570
METRRCTGAGAPLVPLVLALLCAGMEVAAFTAYVAPEGVDTGSCTDPFNPCASIAYAVSVSGVDTVSLSAARHVVTSAVTVTVPAGKAFTITGESSQTTVVDTSRKTSMYVNTFIVTGGVGSSFVLSNVFIVEACIQCRVIYTVDIPVTVSAVAFQLTDGPHDWVMFLDMENTRVIGDSLVSGLSARMTTLTSLRVGTLIRYVTPAAAVTSPSGASKLAIRDLNVNGWNAESYGCCWWVTPYFLGEAYWGIDAWQQVVVVRGAHLTLDGLNVTNSYMGRGFLMVDGQHGKLAGDTRAYASAVVRNAYLSNVSATLLFAATVSDLTIDNLHVRGANLVTGAVGILGERPQISQYPYQIMDFAMTNSEFASINLVGTTYGCLSPPDVNPQSAVIADYANVVVSGTTFADITSTGRGGAALRILRSKASISATTFSNCVVQPFQNPPYPESPVMGGSVLFSSGDTGVNGNVTTALSLFTLTFGPGVVSTGGTAEKGSFFGCSGARVLNLEDTTASASTTVPAIFSATPCLFNLCPECSSGWVPRNVSGACTCIKCPAGTSSQWNCAPCQTGFISPAGATDCTSCAAGTYAAPNASVCLACPDGQISAAASASCTKCQVGRYTTTHLSCSLCPAGQSSPLGASSCSPCPLGTYELARVCTPCPRGQISTSAGSTSCTSCSTGYVTIDGLTCRKCLAGTYASGQQVCAPCAAGTVSGDGAAGCTPCGAGSYSSNGKTCAACSAGMVSSTGSAACTACPSGYISSAAARCVQCPAGTREMSHINCTACPSGYSSAAGSVDCSVCPAGTYSSGGGVECAACPPGFVSAAMSTSCSQCPRGTREVGHTQCAACAAGTVSEPGSIACGQCPEGTYYDNSTSPASCATCPAGQIRTSAMSKCTACAAGTYESWHTQCDACPAGTTSSTGASFCVECPAMTYEVGRTSCAACASGKVSGTGSSTCYTCAFGQIASPGGACTDCPAGTRELNHAECVPCAAGSISAARSTVCTKCPQGTFEIARTACANCSASMPISSEGSAWCGDCPAGSIATVSGACRKCTAGTMEYYHEFCVGCADGYVSAEGSAGCTICPAGTRAVNSVSCTPCPVGYISGAGAMACTACPAGTDENNRLTCDPCPAGQTSAYASGSCTPCAAGTREINNLCDTCRAGSISTSGKTACTSCPPGTYEKDRTSCEPCPLGQTSNGNTQQCTKCPAGTRESNRACVPCAAGFVSDEGSTDCSLCPTGTREFGRVECQLCPVGHVTLASGQSSCDPCSACPAGTKETNNRASCVRCPNDTISSAGSDTCTLCPSGTYESGNTQCKPCDNSAVAKKRCNRGDNSGSSPETGASKSGGFPIVIVAAAGGGGLALIALLALVAAVSRRRYRNNLLTQRWRVWHFDKAQYERVKKSKNPQPLRPAAASDVVRVMESYVRAPVPGYDIAKVETVYSATLEAAFDARLAQLDGRAKSAAFEPKWECDSNPELRREVMNRLRGIVADNKDPHHPNISLMMVWHGTRSDALESILTAGYASLATTDTGFFGKGLYSSTDARYAYQVYAHGALLVNWISFFSAYPVIDGDMEKLEGKSAYANYDAHFVPVCPSSDPADTTSFFPVKDIGEAVYHEIVVFEASQCLPRYLVTLQPSLPRGIDAAPAEQQQSAPSSPVVGSNTRTRRAYRNKEAASPVLSYSECTTGSAELRPLVVAQKPSTLALDVSNTLSGPESGDERTRAVASPNIRTALMQPGAAASSASEAESPVVRPKYHHAHRSGHRHARKPLQPQSPQQEPQQLQQQAPPEIVEGLQSYHPLVLQSFRDSAKFGLAMIFGNRAGTSVGSAGDVNCDGVDDVIVGAPTWSGVGRAYVVFGRRGGFAGPMTLPSDVDGASGFVVNGTQANSGLGGEFSVAGVGDINGDGCDDVLVGLSMLSANSLAENGGVFVVFGHKGPWDLTVDVAQLDGKRGFAVYGEGASDRLGQGAAAGDMNGDGVDDLVLVAEHGGRQAPQGRLEPGFAYVVYGSRAAVPLWSTGVVDLASLVGDNGYKIVGEGSGALLRSPGTAGDFNGDGLADLVVGSPGTLAYTGKGYVVWGRATTVDPQLSLASLTSALGVAFVGERAGDQVAITISSAGDLNGDNLTDIVISTMSTRAYIVWGTRAAWPSATMNLSLAESSGFGLRLLAHSAGDRLQSACGIGDTNGDGVDDLVVGNYWSLGSASVPDRAGRVVVVYGHASPWAWTPSLNLSSLGETTGREIDGDSAMGYLGYATAGGLDFNGDGFSDALIGAWQTNGGSAFVVYGYRLCTQLPLQQCTPSTGCFWCGACTQVKTCSWCGSITDPQTCTLSQTCSWCGDYCMPVGGCLACAERTRQSSCNTGCHLCGSACYDSSVNCSLLAAPSSSLSAAESGTQSEMPVSASGPSRSSALAVSSSSEGTGAARVPEGSKSTPVGAIVGGVVGGCVGICALVAIVAVAVVVTRRRHAGSADPVRSEFDERDPVKCEEQTNCRSLPISAAATVAAVPYLRQAQPDEPVHVDLSLKLGAVPVATLEKMVGEELDDFRQSFRQHYQMHHEDYTGKRIQRGLKPLTFVVNNCWKVSNPVLESWFDQRVAFMRDVLKREPAEFKVRTGFHGTRPENVDKICNAGLLRVGHPWNPTQSTDPGFFGDPHHGVYASRFVEYTLQYSNAKLQGPGQYVTVPCVEGDVVRVVMLKVVPGRTMHMERLVGSVGPSEGYDSHSSPEWAEWYFFDETQTCPTHVVEVQAIVNNRTMADDGLSHE